MPPGGDSATGTTDGALTRGGLGTGAAIIIGAPLRNRGGEVTTYTPVARGCIKAPSCPRSPPPLTGISTGVLSMDGVAPYGAWIETSTPIWPTRPAEPPPSQAGVLLLAVQNGTTGGTFPASKHR